MNAAFRQAFEDLIDQPEALLDLADADPHPRVDVAVVAHRRLEVELVIGRVADRLARIEGAARGAADIASGAEGARERRREIAGGDGAVLERRGVVVELDHARETRPHRLDQRAESLDAAFAEIVGDAAGHDAVHHQPVAETGICRAQGALAQDAAFGIDQREGGVVADGADIAEMIGEALELGHQRAQPNRALRHVDL